MKNVIAQKNICLASAGGFEYVRAWKPAASGMTALGVVGVSRGHSVLAT
jgi:hypothetical protein